MPAPLLLINAVGLTPRLLPHAPRLRALAQQGWMTPLREVTPAVTCSAQATILTGKPVDQHGIVANGWLYPDTREIRFWQQANSLIQAEPFYATARRRARALGRPFKSAKLFWWFNQGAAVDISLTPKPWYGVDGNKIFGITGQITGSAVFDCQSKASDPFSPQSLQTPKKGISPFIRSAKNADSLKFIAKKKGISPFICPADNADFPQSLERQLGPFPFHTFWGPMASLPATQWIAQSAAAILRDHHPDLTLVYLPHLDYDPQRHGPSGCDMPALVRQLDDAAAPLLEEANRQGAQVWVVSEYGHADASAVIFPNRALRQAGLLHVRNGPFGEQLDTFTSRAFAVVDHQIAHVHVRDEADLPRVRDLLAALPGVDQLFTGEQRNDININHPRAGDIVALSARHAFFAYNFWLDDKKAPDYARTVAIHHKPGFDPAELAFDPALRLPKLRAAFRLAQKKLGFRTRMDVIGLDPTFIKGTHGLPATDPQDAALFIGQGPSPTAPILPMTAVAPILLQALDLESD